MRTKHANVSLLMFAVVAMLTAWPASARSGQNDRETSLGDVDVTSSVTLGMLSVRPLGVEKPWDPRVCIGCDRNNRPASARAMRGEIRLR